MRCHEYGLRDNVFQYGEVSGAKEMMSGSMETARSSGCTSAEPVFNSLASTDCSWAENHNASEDSEPLLVLARLNEVSCSAEMVLVLSEWFRVLLNAHSEILYP